MRQLLGLLLVHHRVRSCSVAYLMVLFQIVDADLFRDQHRSAAAMKAVWVVGLIFLPILTARDLPDRRVRSRQLARRPPTAACRAHAATAAAGGLRVRKRWSGGASASASAGTRSRSGRGAVAYRRGRRTQPSHDQVGGRRRWSDCGLRRAEPGHGGALSHRRDSAARQPDDLGVRLVRRDRAAALGDGVLDDPALVAHQRPAAPDQHQRRLAVLAQVAGQPPPEGHQRVLAHAVRRGEQPGLRAAGDDVLGEDALGDEQPAAAEVERPRAACGRRGRCRRSAPRRGPRGTARSMRRPSRRRAARSRGGPSRSGRRWRRGVMTGSVGSPPFL